MAAFQSDSLAMMQRSLVPGETTRRTDRQIDGVPVYSYVRRPDAPPVSVLRFSAAGPPGAGPAHDPADAPAHDFLVLTYFERGGGTVRLDTQEWSAAAGDAFV